MLRPPKGSDAHNYRDHLDGQLTTLKIGLGLPVSIRPIETQPSEILNWHNSPRVGVELPGLKPTWTRSSFTETISALKIPSVY